jgi:hypothetical protein
VVRLVGGGGGWWSRMKEALKNERRQRPFLAWVCIACVCVFLFCCPLCEMDGRLCWFILQAKRLRGRAAGYIVDFVHLQLVGQEDATHTWPLYCTYGSMSTFPRSLDGFVTMLCMLSPVRDCNNLVAQGGCSSSEILYSYEFKRRRERNRENKILVRLIFGRGIAAFSF